MQLCVRLCDVAVLTPCLEVEEAVHLDQEEEEGSQDHKHRNLY